jgi:hypothetical protein
VVTNNVDTIDGDTTSIAALLAMPGLDGISIREAIVAANNTPGADEITFDFGHDGPEVILLTLGELLVTDSLSITGAGAELLTLDADRQSAVLSIEADAVVSITEVAVTKGLANAWIDGAGGIDNRGDLTLKNVWLTQNSGGGAGGILNRGKLLVLGSHVAENGMSGLVNEVDGTASVQGSTFSGHFGVDGGGIINRGVLEVDECIVSNNASFYWGGGIINAGSGVAVIRSSQVIENGWDPNSSPFAPRGLGVLNQGNATIIDTTISDNRTDGTGGGVYNLGEMMISRSTLSMNSVRLYGGAIFNGAMGTLTIEDSTISNNFATLDGGGIMNLAKLTVRRSTIAQNDAGRVTGGLLTQSQQVTIQGSIIAGNGHGDIDLANESFVLAGSHNLIQDGTNVMGLSDTIHADPRLGPLADHGGPTYTHALLPGSPAIDAGDSSIAFDPAEFDQRGFARVANGGLGLRIDIGAYESQGIPDYPVGDFNHDGIANLADYTVWRDTLGSTTEIAADASGNSVVDADDYAIWKQHFGNTTIPLTSAPPAEASLDAALAIFLSPEDEQPETTGLAGQISRGAEGQRLGHRNEELLLTRRARGEPAKRLGEAESPDSRPEVSTDGLKIHLNLRIYLAGLAEDVT